MLVNYRPLCAPPPPGPIRGSAAGQRHQAGARTTPPTPRRACGEEGGFKDSGSLPWGSPQEAFSGHQRSKKSPFLSSGETEIMVEAVQ